MIALPWWLELVFGLVASTGTYGLAMPSVVVACTLAAGLATVWLWARAALFPTRV